MFYPSQNVKFVRVMGEPVPLRGRGDNGYYSQSDDHILAENEPLGMRGMEYDTPRQNAVSYWYEKGEPLQARRQFLDNATHDNLGFSRW
jgi:hypothetical protein